MVIEFSRVITIISCDIYASDENECSSGKHNCSQNCCNTLRGYRCYCKLGYILQADKISCSLKKREIVSKCQSVLEGERGEISIHKTGKCSIHIITGRHLNKIIMKLNVRGRMVDNKTSCSLHNTLIIHSAYESQKKVKL